MSGRPGAIGNIVPPDAGFFARELADLKRRVHELESANPLAAAHIGNGQVLTVDGELDVTGAMVVGGTLSLPDGIIDNAALTNPTTPAAINGVTSGISMPTTIAVLHTEVITVPDGFTTAAVLLCVSVGATSGGSGGNLFGRVTINGVHGSTIVQAAGGAGFPTTLSAFNAQIVTGLTGGDTFNVSGDGNASIAGWTGGNAQLSGIVTFYR